MTATVVGKGYYYRTKSEFLQCKVFVSVCFSLFWPTNEHGRVHNEALF